MLAGDCQEGSRGEAHCIGDFIHCDCVAIQTSSRSFRASSSTAVGLTESGHDVVRGLEETWNGGLVAEGD